DTDMPPALAPGWISATVSRRRTSGIRRSGALPGVGEPVAVEQPQGAGDEQEHELVERPGHGHEAHRGAPPERPWDAPVPHHDPNRANGALQERLHGSTVPRPAAPV